MNLRNIFDKKPNLTYYEILRPILVICLVVSIVVSFPSIHSNKLYISSMLKEYNNSIFSISFWIAATFIDFSKVMFFSTLIFLLYSKKIMDSTCFLGVIMFFGISFFFSYNGLDRRNKQQEVDLLHSELKDSTTASNVFVKVKKGSSRALRKKAEANAEQLAAINALIKARSVSRQELSAMKYALTSSDFLFLLLLDGVQVFCLFAVASIRASKDKDEEKEEEKEENEEQETKENLEKELVKNIQSRYRSAISKNDILKAGKYEKQLKNIGAKIPNSGTGTRTNGIGNITK